jgi:shikimate kinase/3-dehydroquinate synthase
MKTIFLSGLPGAGKSTVGRALAAELGATFVDTDARIADVAGKSASEVWNERGESGFRALEAEVVTQVMNEAAAARERYVVSLGGGTVTSLEMRRRAIAQGIVITLRPDLDVLAARLARDPRPVVAADPAARVRHLAEVRAAAYAECHGFVDSGASLEHTLAACSRIIDQDNLLVPLGEQSYVIDLVDNEPTRALDAVASLGPSSVVLVTDSTVGRVRKAWIDAATQALAVPVVTASLAPGEAGKNLSAVAAIWDAALGAPLDRDAVVLAVGGGVVTDLAGFAGSTLLRGIRTVYAPTTYLAMCDASVGGKTGFDHAAGKNLIGSFYQPSRVVADVCHLETLPLREFRAGLVEAVKVGLVADAALFSLIEAHANELGKGHGPVSEVLRAAVAAKIDVVVSDPTERGRRALLNAGHTIGHALEAGAGYTGLLHGEAVALGLVAELRQLEGEGRSAAGVATRVSAVLRALGLREHATAAERSAAPRYLGADKKRSGSHVRVACIDAIGVGRLERVPMAWMAAGLAHA